MQMMKVVMKIGCSDKRKVFEFKLILMKVKPDNGADNKFSVSCEK